MASLLPTTFTLDLKPAKPNGLADLGVPLGPDTQVKKGKLAEVMQMRSGQEGLDVGGVGRRFQNLRATLLQASEGGHTSVKLIVAFELFGDDNTAVGAPGVLLVQVLGAGQLLAEQPLGRPFLPYGCCWYDNRFAVDLSPEVFARADQVVLLAGADVVRPLQPAAAAV